MKPIKTEYKLIATIMTGALAVFTLAACTTVKPESEVQETASPDTVTISSELSEAFSDKDLEAGYVDSEAETITLNGSSASSDSSDEFVILIVVPVRTCSFVKIYAYLLSTL